MAGGDAKHVSRNLGGVVDASERADRDELDAIELGLEARPRPTGPAAGQAALEQRHALDAVARQAGRDCRRVLLDRQRQLRKRHVAVVWSIQRQHRQLRRQRGKFGDGCLVERTDEDFRAVGNGAVMRLGDRHRASVVDEHARRVAAIASCRVQMGRKEAVAHGFGKRFEFAAQGNEQRQRAHRRWHPTDAGWWKTRHGMAGIPCAPCAPGSRLGGRGERRVELQREPQPSCLERRRRFFRQLRENGRRQPRQTAPDGRGDVRRVLRGVETALGV